MALLVLSLAGLAHLESRVEEPGQSRGGRAAEPPAGAKCTYTFIMPQQKFTGAVCWSSVRAALEPPVPNGSEMRALQEVLGRQQAELQRLRGLVEVDGALVSEVKALRKDSRTMNARVGQLYAQLLHEILQRRQRPGPLAQLEGRVANASDQALQLAAGYRQLELRYEALAALVNNQSVLIAQLERRCQGGAGPSVFVSSQPPLVPVVPPRLSGIANESRAYFDAAAQLQMDQMELAPPSLPPRAPGESGGPWRDCQAARHSGHEASGVYEVQPAGAGQSLQVWCEQELEGGGWTVIQRRQDGSVSFFTTWHHYKHGFGTLDGEHWLGLESTRRVTGQGPGPYALRVLLEDWAGRQAYAHYDRFALEPESDSYRLRLGRYHGSAGDSLAWHDGRPFSTLDRDHDAYSGSCAHYHKGGWWYNACAHCNLNGVWYKGGHYRGRYQDGVYWAEFRGGAYSLRKVVMMVRPVLPAPDA
uniref:Fibrinogen C-terminal domain-containing protein n=1 Tax=Chelonoidis abingdonii TaxID=106734 RepID=A0A8C0HF08_CHEAB